MWRQIASGAWLTLERLHVYAVMLLVASLASAVVWIALADGLIDRTGQPKDTVASDLLYGYTLYHKYNCVNCHGGREVVAVEPAEPLRQILRRKLAAAEHGDRARVTHGFFDQLPLADDFADLVVACSAFTPAPGHGGEAGLAEMERVCRPGGWVVIIWPNHLGWLAARGYRHVSFPGPMAVEFGSYDEAMELAEIFYPKAAAEVRRRGLPSVPFEVLGINPPRDLACKVLSE